MGSNGSEPYVQNIKYLIYMIYFTVLNSAEQNGGAQGRNRTTDTAIFSPYQDASGEFHPFPIYLIFLEKRSRRR